METNQTRLKEVLAVVNNKGGVGKTTTVQSIAVTEFGMMVFWQPLTSTFSEDLIMALQLPRLS